MCGVVGVFNYLGGNVKNDVIYCLKKLEYRGYDSAGISVNGNNGFFCEKAQGKIEVLEEQIKDIDINGFVGIGHTRWATHGDTSVKNAHPIITDYVSIVHNGIIENYAELKKELNVDFYTDTDTEVIARLFDKELKFNNNIKSVTFNVVKKLKGAFSFIVMLKENPNVLIAVKKNSPLVLGIDDVKGKYFICSDAIAFGEVCKNVIYMNDGDVLIINNKNYEFYNNGELTKKEKQIQTFGGFFIDKGGYKHFMIKEIYEQPTVIANTISYYIKNEKVVFNNLLGYKNILIIACGSSYYAGMVAKYWFEEFADIHVDVEVASEFTYRKPVIRKDVLVIVISQSGETADTINAMKYAKDSGCTIFSIVNVMGSAIDRMSDCNFMTLAGPEIGVASTKAFTAQLILMAIMVCSVVKDDDKRKFMINQLIHLPNQLGEVFSMCSLLQKVAEKQFVDFSNALFIARGSLYPIALEGALKLKEISYVHAEGYAAGELKHGPIALIDEKMPVVVIGNSNIDLFSKLKSNVENIRSRKGKVFFFTDSCEYIDKSNVQVFKMPNTSHFLAPILYIIPLQFLAYYTALAKGTDVDQPRNLAKSVTVE